MGTRHYSVLFRSVFGFKSYLNLSNHNHGVRDFLNLIKSCIQVCPCNVFFRNLGTAKGIQEIKSLTHETIVWQQRCRTQVGSRENKQRPLIRIAPGRGREGRT